MTKQSTVVDSSALVNAAIGSDPARRPCALGIIADQTREFAATRFLKLEVLPMPPRYRRNKERWLYERFFDRVSQWLDEEPLLQPALDLACRYGLGALDALHLATAMSLNAELISAEKPRSLCTKLIRTSYQSINALCPPPHPSPRNAPWSWPSMSARLRCAQNFTTYKVAASKASKGAQNIK